MSTPKRIAIIGAGPTGLGAAHRLGQWNHQEHRVYEASSEVGGLASSHLDDAGFTWDLGGHVQFSHYEYFDQLMDQLGGSDWLEHERVATIWIANRMVPYPLQNHIEALPVDLARDCRRGLERSAQQASSPNNFHEWIVATFGDELADLFMLPYNHKVWAHPPAALSFEWIGERVALPASSDVAEPKRGWGPNRTFRFPSRGGSGEIWRRLAATLADVVELETPVVAINTAQKELTLADGRVANYDALISTAPLDRLVHLCGLEALYNDAAALTHSSVHVIGIALEGRPPPSVASCSWIYFPEPHIPFYRATVFSNYAPANVPVPDRHWSLMVEVSESVHRPLSATLLDEVQQQARAAGLLGSSEVLHCWHRRLEHGYPTPTLGRDGAIGRILPALEALDVFSRGRFGGWKYEVSNQDHSLMQGVEVVDRLLNGREETTLFHPNRVNAPGKRPSPRPPQ